MNLSMRERLLLCNQYEILKNAYPNNEAEYNNKIEVLKKGFEIEYYQLFEDLDSDILNTQSCKEVKDILTMFSVLNGNFERLGNAKEIDKNKITFKGFGGNDEGKQFEYVAYLVKKGFYNDILNEENDYNSHFPMLTSYRRMLDEWNNSDNRNQLSKDDIIRIVNARNITNLINQNGVSNDDSMFDEMLENIYRERGRPQTETEEAIS
jgi:uncharacterized protein